MKAYGGCGYGIFEASQDLVGYEPLCIMQCIDPDVIRQHILPQYKRVIYLVHSSGKKFLLHSCGNIFPLMNDIIALGINAKHSNEDQIAPFIKWIEQYTVRVRRATDWDLGIQYQVMFLLMDLWQ
jgi:uroporphyrinogen decarboxylase